MVSGRTECILCRFRRSGRRNARMNERRCEWSVDRRSKYVNDGSRTADAFLPSLELRTALAGEKDELLINMLLYGYPFSKEQILASLTSHLFNHHIFLPPPNCSETRVRGIERHTPNLHPQTPLFQILHTSSPSTLLLARPTRY